MFGHFGDQLGRKSMLVLSMMMMGVASVLIGLLPGYDSIGIAAPLLLVFLRVVQGVAVGGEYGGAALMVAEHAEPRRRGLWVGIVYMGTPLGALLATSAVTLVTLMPERDFLSWGWRIPFLLSAALLVIGLYVRLSVAESPVFREAADSARQRKARNVPALALLRRPRALLLGCAAGIGPFVLTALISSHMLAYAPGVGYETSTVVRMMLLVSVVALIALPVFSSLSDRIGRRRLPLIGGVGAVLFAVPMYQAVDSGSLILLAMALVVGQILQALMMAPLGPLLSELFATRVRYTGVSLSYQMASLIGAGFTPMVAAALVEANAGSSLPLSLIVGVGGAVTVTTIIFVKETRGRDLAVEPEPDGAGTR